MPAEIRPLATRDVGAAADVLFVAAYERALGARRTPAFDAPEAARRFVQRLLEVDPMTAQVAEDDGAVVGVAWTHPRGRVATVGPLAVLPAARGRGVGRTLLDASLRALGERGVQVRLLEDAADRAAVGLALRAGFRVVAPVLELERSLTLGAEPVSLPAGVAVRALGPSHEADLVARDTRAWGAPRPQDVAALLAHGAGGVLERRDRVLAHALAVAGDHAVVLGPAADDDGTQVALLLAHLAASAARELQRPARVLAPAGDRRLVDALLAWGFRLHAVLVYLVHGGGTAPPAGSTLCSRWMA